MRVIGGSARGRRLPARLPKGVRPTSDRVREAIFNIVWSRGGVEGRTVVDLFCGSGALGIEALSRGAASVTFVDHDLEAIAAARANLAAAGIGESSWTVVRAELPAWLGRAPRVDVALCDPPYAFDDWTTLLGALRADLAVVESARPLPEGVAGWQVARTRRYGGTLVTVLRATPDPTHATGSARAPMPTAAVS